MDSRSEKDLESRNGVLFHIYVSLQEGTTGDEWGIMIIGVIINDYDLGKYMDNMKWIWKFNQW